MREHERKGGGRREEETCAREEWKKRTKIGEDGYKE